MLSTRRFAALFVIGAAVAVPMVGCGSSSDDNSTSNAATPASTSGGSSGAGGTVDLTATDFKFDSSEPSVKSGNVTFNLKNDGQVTHSLEIEDVNGEDQELEGDVSPGSNGTLAVNLKPGTYEFYCPVDSHKQMGMTGEITVK
jgi:plastocyanin